MDGDACQLSIQSEVYPVSKCTRMPANSWKIADGLAICAQIGMGLKEERAAKYVGWAPLDTLDVVGAA